MTAFQINWAEWLALTETCDEQTFERFAALEKELLDHRPRSLDEARRILDVILVQTDPRSDGRDVKALKRVRAVLLAAVERETRAPASRRAAAA